MHFSTNDPSQKEFRQILRRKQTDAEALLWQKLRNRQFLGHKFYRQYGIGPYILDFFCQSLHLAIELDGSQHSEAKQRRYDTKRTEYLAARGITVIRFWDNEVLTNIDGVLEMVYQQVTPPDLPLRRGGE